MTIFSPRILIFLLGALVLLTTVDCLSCYSCNELINANCKNIYYGPVDIRNCRPNEVCVKQRSISRGVPAVISRGCALEGYCNIVEELTDICTTCYTDYCNS